MVNIELNDDIVYGKNIYRLVSLRKLGIDLYGILIKTEKGGSELRTFNDLTIAKLALFNIINKRG